MLGIVSNVSEYRNIGNLTYRTVVLNVSIYWLIEFPICSIYRHIEISIYRIERFDISKYRNSDTLDWKFDIWTHRNFDISTHRNFDISYWTFPRNESKYHAFDILYRIRFALHPRASQFSISWPWTFSSSSYNLIARIFRGAGCPHNALLCGPGITCWWGWIKVPP